MEFEYFKLPNGSKKPARAGFSRHPEKKGTASEAPITPKAVAHPYLHRITHHTAVFRVLGCLTLLMLFLFITPGFFRFETLMLDSFFKFRSPIRVHPDIVIVEITEDSIQTFGPLPWPRKYHAVLLHILNQWKVKSIVCHFMFRMPTSPANDGALIEAISQSRNVFLPVYTTTQTSEPRWMRSVEFFERPAKGLGHVNIPQSADGVVRRFLPYVQVEKIAYPHLGVLAAMDYLDKNVESAADISIPLDKEGYAAINWTGKWTETFKHYSFKDVLQSYDAVYQGETPRIPAEAFKNKIVLVAYTGNEQTDSNLQATPFDAAYPGVGITANIINSILTKQFIRPAPFWVNAFCLIIIGSLTMFFFIPFRNFFSVAAAFLLSLFWGVCAFLLFAQWGIWMAVVQPVILIFSLLIFSSVAAKMIGDRERRHYFQLATRDGLTGLYVIRHFREMLNREVLEARENGESLTLLVIDLDHFKRVNDTFGHAAGDHVLRTVAQIISTCFRSKRPIHEADQAARYGGEEFFVMLHGASMHPIGLMVAERIRRAVEVAEITWEGKKIPVTLSVGVAALHADENIPDLMVRRADEALYRAKRQGRNRVSLESEVPNPFQPTISGFPRGESGIKAA